MFPEIKLIVKVWRINISPIDKGCVKKIKVIEIKKFNINNIIIQVQEIV